jgi:hypothetical protein
LAQSKDDKWLYVINQDTYIQGIRIEKCAWVCSQFQLQFSFKNICYEPSGSIKTSIFLIKWITINFTK